MKKLILACLVGGAIAVPSAFALPTVTLTIGAGNDLNTGGGAFNAATSADGSFLTFCVESGEHFSPGQQYYYTVSDVVKNDPGSPNTVLTLPTAWLYSNLLNGTLAGYGPNATQEDALQRAIWFFESEAGGDSTSPYVALALAGTGLDINNARSTAANGAYGVHVMNLWANPDGTGASQDQLIRVPDGGSTLTLLGMGMGFMALVSRRLRT